VSTGSWIQPPPRRAALLREEQRRVYGQPGWMMVEAVRRFDAWLVAEATALVGHDTKRVRRIVDRVLERLVQLDVTRFDDGDRQYLEAELRNELQLAMRPRARSARAASRRKEKR
jgi:hypothetical protein